MAQGDKSADKVEKLAQTLRGRNRLWVFVQTPPDPDALASAAALAVVAETLASVKSAFVFGGVLGRVENHAVVRHLRMNLVRARDVEIGENDAVALVDSQPHAGNNPLPDDVEPDIVIDHHPIRDETRRCPFTDVRSPYGATSTILTEYLQTLGVQPSARLATALLYGIRSDTEDLGREASKADIDSTLFLYPLADKRLLARIERERVPLEYFHTLAEALHKAVVYGPVVVSQLRRLDNPDAAAEMADLLMRLENVRSAFCFGVYEDAIVLSLRHLAEEEHAGELMQRIVKGVGRGGGHGVAAGGQVPLPPGDARARDRLLRLLRRRAFRVLGVDAKTRRKLVPSSRVK